MLKIRTIKKTRSGWKGTGGAYDGGLWHAHPEKPKHSTGKPAQLAEDLKNQY